MALMSGWYFGEKLKNLGRADLFCRRSLLFGGLTALLLIAFFGLFGLLWLGKIQLGSQEIAAMQSVGLFIGLLAIVGIVAYFWQRIYREVERPVTRNPHHPHPLHLTQPAHHSRQLMASFLTPTTPPGSWSMRTALPPPKRLS
ncbi:MAG: alkaline shock response membrane anchor protein AmaP [Chloroflexi bacterium]|nr:alkaline shock response membrane anchor protein AmaP [Chloroflexota bacterium]